MALNLSMGKLPWYSQIGAFAALTGLGVVVFWNWVARPAQEAIVGQQLQLANVRVEIARGQATAKRLATFRSQVGDLELQLNRLRSVLPEEKDVGDLLRRIQDMATQSNLTIRGFTPRAVATKQMYAEWPIGLQLEGTYHNLGAFLERVSKFPRIINVTAIKVSSREAQTADATITAECTATTFVMVEPPAVPAGPVAKPAPAAAVPARPKGAE